jgi:hypothetical protein
MDIFDAILFIVIGSIIFAVFVFPLFLMSIIVFSLTWRIILVGLVIYIAYRVIKTSIK